MWRRITTLGLTVGYLASACAAGASSEASTVAEAEVIASGTIAWGDGPDQQFSWGAETIDGFTHALSFTVRNQRVVASISASRTDADDMLWFVATSPTEGAPIMVFGGAPSSVEGVVLIDEKGQQVALDLTPVPNRDWSLAVHQLPAEWAVHPAPAIDVVAVSDGAEIAREPLLGLA